MNTIIVQSKGVPVPIDSIVQKQLTIEKTHPGHFSIGGEDASVSQNTDSTSFTDILLTSLDKASSFENNALQLAQQAQLDSSINEHDVTIANAKAKMAIQITRSIVDRALEAYRSIIALR